MGSRVTVSDLIITGLFLLLFACAYTQKRGRTRRQQIALSSIAALLMVTAVVRYAVSG